MAYVRRQPYNRFRKVSVRIWGDDKFMSLDTDAQLAFLHLLTHPSLTSIGAMRLTAHGFAAERRRDPGQTAASLAALETGSLIRFDRDHCLLWLPKYLQHNKPENPNVVKSWARALSELPECELLDDIVSASYSFVSTLPESFMAAFDATLKSLGMKPLRKGSRKGSANPSRNPLANRLANQEQEQEQEQEQKLFADTDKARKKRQPDVIWDKVAELFFDGAVSKSEASRCGKIVSALKEKNATPDEIATRLARYKKTFAGAVASPEALVKHWGILKDNPVARDGRENRRPGKYDC